MSHSPCQSHRSGDQISRPRDRNKGMFVTQICFNAYGKSHPLLLCRPNYVSTYCYATHLQRDTCTLHIISTPIVFSTHICNEIKFEFSDKLELEYLPKYGNGLQINMCTNNINPVLQ